MRTQQLIDVGLSKLERLIHYICARCENPYELGVTKLNKILWYADVLSFATEGRTITGTVYVKRQFGPVPKDIMAARNRLKQHGAIVERQASYHTHNQTQLIALLPPDISMFTAEDISQVDMVMHAICSGHTARSISAASHDLVWEAAEIGEEIPMEAAAFAGNLGEINETDVEWAKSQISKFEQETPAQA